MSLLDADSNEVGAFRRGLFEGFPFVIVERRAAVNKEFFRRRAMLALECFEHLGNQALRFFWLKMEFKVAGFPRAVRAPKHHGVTFVKEHLRRATGVFPWVVGNHLEHESDITNARPDVGEFPRWLRLRFV